MMELWIKIGICILCVGIVIRGVVLELIKIRHRDKCPHKNKTLVLRYYPDSYDQFKCDDCGADIFEDIR